MNTTRPRGEEATISNLQPDHVYIFSVRAYNQHGPGPSSPPIRVATLPVVSTSFSRVAASTHTLHRLNKNASHLQGTSRTMEFKTSL